MEVSRNGQVTIPRRIRDAFAFHPGSEIEFQVENGHVILALADANGPRNHRIVKRMRGTATTSMTTDEIMALTRA
ncbi:MAG: AbrB/MazE/SpoVT family DNA-binding domain-containing protein [Trueperaceae bacterium]